MWNPFEMCELNSGKKVSIERTECCDPIESECWIRFCHRIEFVHFSSCHRALFSVNRFDKLATVDGTRFAIRPKMLGWILFELSLANMDFQMS